MISITMLSLFISLLLTGEVHLADSNQLKKGFCSFPTFLWATESSLGDFGDSNDLDLNRRWITETEYRASGDGWIRSTRIVAWPSRLTVKREIDGYCGTGSYRLIENFEPVRNSKVRRRPSEKIKNHGVDPVAFVTNFRVIGGDATHRHRHHHRRRRHKKFEESSSHTNFHPNSTQVNTPILTDHDNVYDDLPGIKRGRRGNWGSAKPPCFEREPAYDIICLSEETNNKFRIRYKNLFSCVKFEPIQENVVRVWKASPNRINEALLCNDDSLIRQQWPWISYEKQRHVQCPSIGGFDFRAYIGEGKGVCVGEWLPSRMEMGCMVGEDLLFIFQKNKCSLFPRPDQEHRFKCWAHWKEGENLFIVFGETKKEARYIMRLPRNTSSLLHVSGHLFTSPVAPFDLNNQDSTPGSVFLLQLNRSEPGMCYDENSLSCKNLSRNGHCRSSLENSAHCQKSCSLCDPLKPLRHECRFPVETRGTWLSISESGRTDEVHIDEGRLAISGLGEFICKNRHPRSNEYKLVISFQNGCRPKYSCIELLRTDNDLLSLRMSRFSKWDLPFESFYYNINRESGVDDDDDDDSLVMNQSIKQLKLAGDVRESTCDFRLSAEAEVTFSNMSRCLGSLSDLDPVTCQTRSNMVVNLAQCSVKNQIEFKCLTSFDLLNNERLLVTRPQTNKLGVHNRNICWKVKVSPTNHNRDFETETMRGKNRPKSTNLKIIIHRVKCRTWEHVFMTSHQGDVMSIKITKEIMPQSCPSLSQSVINKSTNRDRTFKPATNHWLGQNEVSQSPGKEPFIGYKDHRYSDHRVFQAEHKRTIQVYKNGFITVAEDFFTNQTNMASVDSLTVIHLHWLMRIIVVMFLYRRAYC